MVFLPLKVNANFSVLIIQAIAFLSHGVENIMFVFIRRVNKMRLCSSCSFPPPHCQLFNLGYIACHSCSSFFLCEIMLDVCDISYCSNWKKFKEEKTK
jgi:hypothetical protein